MVRNICDTIRIDSNRVESVDGVGWQSMCESYEKKPKRYVEGIARNVDVYINPWRVQSDVFVVVNSRDIKKKKSNARVKTCF